MARWYTRNPTRIETDLGAFNRKVSEAACAEADRLAPAILEKLVCAPYRERGMAAFGSPMPKGLLEAFERDWAERAGWKE